MRSGLQKPGAIPFLALIVFSLLSLVPSLSNDWQLYNVKTGYIGYHNEARHVPHIKPDSAGQWLITGSYQPFTDRASRRRAAKNAPPRSSFESAPVLDNPPPTYALNEVSTLTRGVRAFKTFFIQQLDDYQIFQTLSTRSTSVKTTPSRPVPNIANSSVMPVLTVDSQHASQNNHTTVSPETPLRDSGLQSVLRQTWQQVCHGGIDILDRIDTFADSRTAHLRSLCSLYFETTGRRSTTPIQRPEIQPKGISSKDSHPTIPPTAQAFPVSTKTPCSVAAADHSKFAGAGGNSKQMRSSCMAIVIGLVVGIMWF